MEKIAITVNEYVAMKRVEALVISEKRDSVRLHSSIVS
jgi:hypothetical protein